MAAKDYIDPEGYWLDPSGNIRRMGTTEEDELIKTLHAYSAVHASH